MPSTPAREGSAGCKHIFDHCHSNKGIKSVASAVEVSTVNNRLVLEPATYSVPSDEHTAWTIMRSLVPSYVTSPMVRQEGGST